MSRAQNPDHRSTPARLALRLPDAGSSGIIDVADLRAEPIPLSLVPPGPAPRPPKPSRAWPLWGLTAMLGASVMALGLAVVSGPTPTVLVRDAAPIDRPLPMHEADTPVTAAVLEAHEATAPPKDVDASERGDAKAEAATKKTGTSPKAPRASNSRSSRSANKAKTKRKTTRSSKASSSSGRPSIPVECVLDPSRCDGTSKTGAGSSTPAPAGPAKRPEKLSVAQLKSALSSTKAQARRCGPEHGVDPGTRVRVKLSIEGASGRVVSATAEGAHAGTSLGRCVANALSRTEFPRFGAKRMGTLYSVRM